MQPLQTPLTDQVRSHRRTRPLGWRALIRGRNKCRRLCLIAWQSVRRRTKMGLN